MSASAPPTPTTAAWLRGLPTGKRIVLGITAAALAAAASITGWHLSTCQEDSCVVWVCSWMGDRQCGPGVPAVDLRLPPPSWD